MEVTFFGKQFFINKVLFFCVILLLIICSGIFGYFLKQVYQPLANSDITRGNTEIIQSTVVEPSDEMLKAEEEPEIKVYVIGCVKKPGIVIIKKGEVIDDAIKKAGGATKDADLENINLAFKLNENTMLRIKSKALKVAPATTSAKVSSNKAVVASSASSSKADSGKVPDTNKMNSGVDIVTDSLGVVVAKEDDDINNGAQKSNKININKATQAELENLPNVGPATAKAIIEYREKNDGFKKLTDIMKITGIKQKTYDKIKDSICIE